MRGASAAPRDAHTSTLRGLEFEPVRLRTLDGAEIDSQELTGLAFLPNDQGALVWEKSGILSHYVLSGDGFTLRGEIQLPEIFDEGDCGLISVAVDPDWPNNGLIRLRLPTSSRVVSTVAAVTRTGRARSSVSRSFS